MNKFKVFNSKGQEGYIILGDLVQTGFIPKIEVIELKFKNNSIENEIATFVKSSDTDKLCLQFRDNTLLKITNQELIEYANNLNKVNKTYKDAFLYRYTREGSQNYSL